MKRSKWKGPYISFNKIKNFNNSLQIISRKYEIIPSFLGKTFNIYNGKIFSQLTITENMLGYKFGEFIPTRKKFTYKKKKKK